jgi:hypothetical protein
MAMVGSTDKDCLFRFGHKGGIDSAKSHGATSCGTPAGFPRPRHAIPFILATDGSLTEPGEAIGNLFIQLRRARLVVGRVAEEAGDHLKRERLREDRPAGGVDGDRDRSLCSTVSVNVAQVKFRW